MNLKQLQPSDVFTYFEALTQIPRESGQEQEVSDYLVAFAKGQGLEVVQEPCLNVIIKKPASPGYESAPTVILQGHMDMVCVKEDDLDFDFKTMPLPITIDGDWVATIGTTLGADNGIAVAMAMALLADKEAKHPALEVLITVEEETGMDGAMKLNPDNLSGQILINIDSDNEGVATVSCAGGGRYVMELPLAFEDAPDLQAFQVVVSGLKGGHSGVEIGVGRANANKLMGRILYELTKNGARLANVFGGEKDNAISKRGEAIVFASENLPEQLANLETRLQSEFSVTDPNIKLTATKIQGPEQVFTPETQEKIVSILQLVPFGPQSMSASIDGLVVSSNNPGVLVQEAHKLVLTNAVRSSVGSLKRALYQQLEVIANLTGAATKIQSDYPEWEYAPQSRIRDLMVATYEELTGEGLKVEAIHAGLECGFLGERLGAIDMVSIGPNMRDIHTPKERLSISSTANTYKFIKATLERLK